MKTKMKRIRRVLPEIGLGVFSFMLQFSLFCVLHHLLKCYGSWTQLDTLCITLLFACVSWTFVIPRICQYLFEHCEKPPIQHTLSFEYAHVETSTPLLLAQGLFKASPSLLDCVCVWVWVWVYERVSVWNISCLHLWVGGWGWLK